MDILLIFYSILLAGILALPFLYIRFHDNLLISQEGEIKSSLHSERKMLLENLKDLKIEMDTGKIHSTEFSDLSQDIITNLKNLDEKLASMQTVMQTNKVIGLCNKCNFHTLIPNAKFCAMCGNSLDH